MEIERITTSSPAFPDDFVFNPPVVEQGIIEQKHNTPDMGQDVVQPKHKQQEFLTTPTMGPP